MALKPFCSISSDIAISSETKYHTPTILQELIK